MVDDGIANGSNVFAAIRIGKKKGAGKILVVAPVSGSGSCSYSGNS
jgi:predicted phosphoribosyltransferase